MNDTRDITFLSNDCDCIEGKNSAAAKDVSRNFGDFCDIQHDHSYCLSEKNGKYPHGRLQESEPVKFQSNVKLI